MNTIELAIRLGAFDRGIGQNYLRGRGDLSIPGSHRRIAAGHRPCAEAWPRRWQALMFLLPAAFLLLIGLIVPIFATAISSLTNETGAYIGFRT